MSACTDATEATKISTLLAAAAALVAHDYAVAAVTACEDCGEGGGSGSGSAQSTEPEPEQALKPTPEHIEASVLARISQKYRELKANQSK